MRQPGPGRLIGKACNNRGARATLAAIRSSEHRTIPRWCDAHGVNLNKLTSRLKGQRKTYPIDLLQQVEKLTGVPASWWLETADAVEGNLNAEV